MSDFLDWYVLNWRYNLYLLAIVIAIMFISFKMSDWLQQERSRKIMLPMLITLFLMHVIIALTWDIGKRDNMLMLSFLFFGNFVFYFGERKKHKK